LTEPVSHLNIRHTGSVQGADWILPSDIREFTPESWRDRIGVVFQDPILFSGTVHENIAYGSPNVTREDVEDAARKANCDFIWSLPNGFDTVSE
jgi:ABC-type multidrug transport system fused ATPase/permease subunit